MYFLYHKKQCIRQFIRFSCLPFWFVQSIQFILVRQYSCAFDYLKNKFFFWKHSRTESTVDPPGTHYDYNKFRQDWIQRNIQGDEIKLPINPFCKQCVKSPVTALFNSGILWGGKGRDLLTRVSPRFPLSRFAFYKMQK